MESFHKIMCKLNLHSWVDKPVSFFHKNLDGSSNYFERFCSYCNKYQYKEKKGKWKTYKTLYTSNVQQVYKEAVRLAEKAVTLSNEFAKFNSHKKVKTKVFMNLLYVARGLTADYARLQKDIRQLHISKQRSDIERDKVSGIVCESII